MHASHIIFKIHSRSLTQPGAIPGGVQTVGVVKIRAIPQHLSKARQEPEILLSCFKMHRLKFRIGSSSITPPYTVINLCASPNVIDTGFSETKFGREEMN